MDLKDAISRPQVVLAKLRRVVDCKMDSSTDASFVESPNSPIVIREGLLSTSPRDSSFEWWEKDFDLKTGYNLELLDNNESELEPELAKEGLESALAPVVNDSFDDDIVSGVWGLSWERKRRQRAEAADTEDRAGVTRCREAGAWMRRKAASFATGVGEKAATLIKRTSSLRLRKQQDGTEESGIWLSKYETGTFVLLPDGMRRRAWDALGLILLVCLLLAQAVNERWRKQHDGWLYADVQNDNPHLAHLLKIKVLLDCFYFADIFVNFRTAYQDENN
eukprot:1885330-Rhodomonas_salina.1